MHTVNYCVLGLRGREVAEQAAARVAHEGRGADPYGPHGIQIQKCTETHMVQT